MDAGSGLLFRVYFRCKPIRKLLMSPLLLEFASQVQSLVFKAYTQDLHADAHGDGVATQTALYCLSIARQLDINCPRHVLRLAKHCLSTPGGRTAPPCGHGNEEGGCPFLCPGACAAKGTTVSRGRALPSDSH